MKSPHHLFLIGLIGLSAGLNSHPGSAAPAPASETKSEQCASDDKAIQYISITAKLKNEDRYDKKVVGCIPFTLDKHQLDETARTALTQTVKDLLARDNVIRVFIDSPGGDGSTAGDDELYRKRAFAIKRLLVAEGVFEHLKKNRNEHFISRFPEPPAPKTAARPAQKTLKKSKKKPPDTYRLYTYHHNVPTVRSGSAGPPQYPADATTALQFIPLENVYFATNADELNERARSTLESITRYILRQPYAEKIIVEAHTDSRAGRRYNYSLADRRAESVVNYLIDAGLPPALIEVISLGESAPSDENWTREGRARNRRVALYLITRHAPAAAHTSGSPPPSSPEAGDNDSS